MWSNFHPIKIRNWPKIQTNIWSIVKFDRKLTQKLEQYHLLKLKPKLCVWVVDMTLCWTGKYWKSFRCSLIWSWFKILKLHFETPSYLKLYFENSFWKFILKFTLKLYYETLLWNFILNFILKLHIETPSWNFILKFHLETLSWFDLDSS